MEKVLQWRCTRFGRKQLYPAWSGQSLVHGPRWLGTWAEGGYEELSALCAVDLLNDHRNYREQLLDVLP